ncbi:37520_t:CDS:2, partial [Gigaspora margarita]
MSTKNTKESIIEIEDGEVKELYLATNPFGRFVVEFELLPNGSNELNDKALSSRKLEEIVTSKQKKTFKFTLEQSKLINSEDKLSWSVAVSDKLYQDKSRKQTFRLLAISCISKDDMTYEKAKDHNDISGFTIIFSINLDDDYLITKLVTPDLDKYGGKVKLFSKYAKKSTNKSSQNMDEKNIDEDNVKKSTNEKYTDKDNQKRKTNEDEQNLDKFFLIILNVSGIFKYYFKHLNYNPTGKFRSFKYPKRIFNALKNNKQFGPEFNLKYIQKCLNVHYFLVDTTYEGAQYMDLYDLRTNQLVNTFKRQNLNSLNLIADIPDFVAISHNNKLLAYLSGNNVKLYLIDCGLEIASIELITKAKKSDVDYYYDYFMHFFNNDESLLIYRSKYQWANWNFFGLEQKSIELKNHHQLDLKLRNIFSDRNYYKLERSNSFIIIVKNKEKEETKFTKDRRIYDGFISRSKSDNSGFKELSLKESFVETTDGKKIKHFIDDKKSELDDYYHIFEPWLYTPTDVKSTPQYSVYLDEKNETLLLIGTQTIQVCVINKSDSENIIIEKIEYAIRKFKISFQDSKKDKKNIEMGCDDDIINAVIEACHTLKFLNSIYNDIDSSEDCILKTLDSILSKLGNNEPSNNKKPDWDCLLHEKSIHMPQFTSWEDKHNTIQKAFDKTKGNNPEPVYLGYLLEYYSNKAVEDIGWMISVGEILPKLYEKSHENGFFKSYLQILLYKPCFCSQELDIPYPYFDFLTIPPSTSNSLEIFIPITQLIPQDSDLKVEEISEEKIPYVQMVPFIDFVTNNAILKEKGNKYKKRILNFLKSLIFPNQFVFLDIPIISIIENVVYDYNNPFYINPSTEAIMNFMWHASKSHWFYTLYIFIIYFLSYSIITWMYVAHMNVTSDFQHILMFATVVLFFYLTYYRLIVEFNQALSKKWDYLKDPFNWVDLFSLILPFIITVYILLEYYTIEDGFKYAE